MKSCFGCFHFKFLPGTFFARCMKNPEVYKIITKEIFDKKSKGAKELQKIAEKCPDYEGEEGENA
ncbi:hypothetical protein DRH14_02970 [Candidatus Shapirobacteria bacterium]|nr:MAG: hypothetical protein DRH14_02970 [Candidatus Shapirobacteria bacterium]